MNRELLEVAKRLDILIRQITPDEFAWQEANYERNSVLGRELLFLIANDSWIRATSEIIDIARSDAIETTIEVDVDLSLIAHEAFRERTGQIWLPIAALPPLQQSLLSNHEPFSTLTVTDASGAPLMTLPRSDIRHRLAAALTEIIVNVAVARLHDVSSDDFSPGRDHRLVLSAAIYRLLRNEVVPEKLLKGDTLIHRLPNGPMGRIGQAANQIGGMLASFAQLLREPIQPGQANLLDARRLTERAIKVLEAVTNTTIIVVPGAFDQRPAVFTVTLPGRALHLAEKFGPDAPPGRQWIKSTKWRRHLRFSNWIFPGASVHLDLLLPSASADRHVRVNLPEGISPDPSLSLAGRADLHVRSEQPPSMGQLTTVIEQLLAVDPAWPVPLRQSLADLALAKANAVEVTLRDHHAGADDDQQPLGTEEALEQTRIFRDKLQALTSALDEITVNGRGDPGRKMLESSWASGIWIKVPMQRRTSTDTISPGVVAARVRSIDDVAQRSATTSARMEVQIAVTDSAYYTAARLSGWINILLMIVVLGFFGIGQLFRPFQVDDPGASAEVLALALTLFSAIQLGRIERNDRSIVRGVLVPAGNPLIVAAILPTVVLAVAFAFSHSFIWADSWTAGCILWQAAQQFVAWRKQRQLLKRGRTGEDPGPEPDLLLYTDAPDYTHDLVLHSDWWQTTTAEALMMGRDAYGYVIWQPDDQRALNTLLDCARPTQTQLANVLSLQRSGTYGQALNFAVFRDEPDVESDWSKQAVPVSLNPIMLTLGVDATVDVFLGLPDQFYAKVREHPVTAVLRLATMHGLATCETRLPVPAPDVSYADLTWARIELSARPEDLDHIPRFLTDLLAIAEPAIVGVRTRRDGLTRILNPRLDAASSEAADQTRLAFATDLDIVTRSPMAGENHGGENWRVMAICADWRIGIEARTLDKLDPDQALVGITTTVLYGQSVLLLLCHAKSGSAPGDDPELRKFIAFSKWQSRARLGTAEAHPLLRVHLRTPDRPGATIGVLGSLREAIRHVFPIALTHGDISVLYARSEVRDGNTAHVQFTVLLPIPADHDPHPPQAWTARDLWLIERRALAHLADAMADREPSAAFSVSGAEIPPDTTIQLGLIKLADLTSRSSEHCPSPTTASDPDTSDLPAAELPEDGLTPNQSATAGRKARIRVLLTLTLACLAIALAAVGIVISGAPFLSFGPDVIIASVSALGSVVNGVAALLLVRDGRKSTSHGRSASRGGQANMRPHLLTRNEFAIIKAYRRGRH